MPAYKATLGTGLFPETLITQRIQESGWSPIPNKLASVHNYHGIKADAGWTGKVISISTHEELSPGKRTLFSGTGLVYKNRAEALAKGAHHQTLFRVFNTLEDGFRGWVQFLQKNSRYTKAGVFTAKTPQEQFAALKAAGFATDSRYVQALTSVYNGLASSFAAWRKEAEADLKKKVNSTSLGGLFSNVSDGLRFFFTGK